MIIVTSFFGREPKYKKLLNIFYNSAKEYMPNSEIRIINTPLPRYGYGRNKIINHHWDTYYSFMTKISKAIEINDNVLMADSDIMFTDSVNSVWQKDFDIAITVRQHRCKYNTGIVFVKPTDEAKKFLKIWKRHTREVADEFNLTTINKWWGIDQASLVKTLQECKGTKVIELPCLEWNAEQTCWKHINGHTRVIHIKSGLRRVYFGEEKLIMKRHGYLSPILERMRSYEHTRERITFY